MLSAFAAVWLCCGVWVAVLLLFWLCGLLCCCFLALLWCVWVAVLLLLLFRPCCGVWGLCCRALCCWLVRCCSSGLAVWGLCCRALCCLVVVPGNSARPMGHWGQGGHPRYTVFGQNDIPRPNPKLQKTATCNSYQFPLRKTDPNTYIKNRFQS